MEEAGLSASTIQRRISTLSTALEIACEDEKLDSVPKLPYPTRKKDKAPVYIKTEEEEDRLRAELLSLDRPTNPTNNGGHPWLPGTGTVLALVADILLQTGMRVSELILARKADLVGNTLVLNQQKSGSPGSVPLNADAREYLKRLWDHPTWWRVVKGTLDERGNVVDEERRRAYKWIEYRFRPAAKRAGLGDITLHKLRHTAASRMIMRGVPIYEVQKVLRHSSTEVTQIYAHLSADHLQDAVATLSRRKPGEAKESNVVELRRNTA
ncbi:site-specific integrase [Marinicauda algicola]|uniref:Site-specific integrase n=1 Tax=Marinicauda algicola TaxID=2029849 RepID=A0A4S2GZM3_9PROT|nr:site-specific integrase [Marinicauda algicola]TGY88616.1 site-specific integrase [Marinicauda algicola]